ncbi:hypothetical protein FHS15_003977 [Paenibacillus castaneae]|uniref:hypothetical protein n=1 Tax=Paenibacillus castaneae TaxID=474957 RepID=UPI0011AF9B65|nr:hypothetical protein [Paenibacillus castaneae]NIK78831.1 hypothetical protein [Paenibacillus castaneae]
MQKCSTWSSKRRSCGESDAEVQHMEREAAVEWLMCCRNAAHGARSDGRAAKVLQKRLGPLILESCPTILLVS